jgi:Flagellar basal body rod FlgEFG protein C-terminal
MQVMYTALGGLQQAEGVVNQAASKIAHLSFPAANPQDQVSLSDQAVALLEGKTSFEANLGSIKVADEMQKSTLSLIA